jgi:hypothetical protein
VRRLHRQRLPGRAAGVSVLHGRNHLLGVLLPPLLASTDNPKRHIMPNIE